MPTSYAVITIGCTECSGGLAEPETALVTFDFAEASKCAAEISASWRAQGDAFVVRLTDGAIVAKLDSEGHVNIWTESK